MTTAEAERERRLRTQCQALLTVAQNLFTHLGAYYYYHYFCYY